MAGPPRSTICPPSLRPVVPHALADRLNRFAPWAKLQKQRRDAGGVQATGHKDGGHRLRFHIEPCSGLKLAGNDHPHGGNRSGCAPWARIKKAHFLLSRGTRRVLSQGRVIFLRACIAVFRYPRAVILACSDTQQIEASTHSRVRGIICISKQ